MKKLFKLGFVGLLLSVLVGASSCYKSDIDDIEERLAALESTMATLENLRDAAFTGANWNASEGVLTLTTANGGTETITIGKIPTYNIRLDGNVLYVNDVPAGSVSIPTIPADVTAADFTVSGGFLYFRGTTTGVAIPTGTTAEFDFSMEVEDGFFVFYNGDEEIGRQIPVVEFKDGVLYIGGVAQFDLSEIGITEEHAIIIQKDDDGNIVGVTLTVGDDSITLPIGSAGQALYSLNVIPPMIHDGMPAIGFYYIQELTHTPSTDVVTPVANSYGLSSTPEVSFRYNPTGTKIDDTNITWSFINRGIFTTRATGDNVDLITILPYEGGAKFKKDPAGGAITFKLFADYTNSDFDRLLTVPGRVYDYINLKANAPVSVTDESLGKQDIVSPEVKVLFEEAKAFIGDKISYTMSSTTAWSSLSEFDYPVLKGVVTTKDPFVGTGAVGLEVGDYTIPDAYAHEVVYTGTYDLLDYVFANVEVGGVRYLMEDQNFTDYSFRFSSVSFTPTDDTDQAWFVTLNGSKFTIADYRGTSAINRTPIFKAEIVSEITGKVVAIHFLKFVITETAPTNLELDPIKLGEIPYLSLYTHGTSGKPGIPVTGPQSSLDLAANVVGTALSGTGTEGNFATPAYYTKLTGLLTWQKINTDVYAKLKVSHAEFVDLYNVNAEVTPGDGGVSVVTDHDATDKGASGRLLPDRPIVVANMANQDLGTSPLSFYIHPQTRFGEHTWNIVIKRKDGRAAVTIPVTFTLTPPATPEFDPNFVATTEVANTYTGVTRVLGKLDNPQSPTEYIMQATLAESFKGGMMINFKNTVVDKIFALKNTPAAFDNDDEITGFQVHTFAYGFTDNAVGGYYTANLLNGRAVGTSVNNGQIFQFNGVHDVYHFLTQDIGLTKPINVASWDYIVKFRSTYENMCDVDKTWTVRFINPLTVTVKDTELATTSFPTVQALKDLIISVKVNGTSIYTNGNAVSTNPALYGFDPINEFGWVLQNTQGFTSIEHLMLSSQTVSPYSPTTAVPFNTLVWDHQGTVLLNDVTEILNVTIATDYATITVPINVKLQKTVQP